MRLDLDIPKAWPELSQNQLLFVSKLHMEGLKRAEFLSLCLLKFTGLVLVKKPDINGNFLFKKNGNIFTIDVDMFYTLCEKLSWLIDSVGQVMNPVKIGRSFGCNQRLYGVSLEQMLMADNYFKAYNELKDIRILAKFTAIFYHKRWQKFNSKKVKIRYRKFLRHKAHLNIVLMWYTGVRIGLRERFPYLYKPANEADCQSPEEIVLNTLSALNNGDITKNKELYKSESIEALKQLNNLAERAEKLKK